MVLLLGGSNLADKIPDGEMTKKNNKAPYEIQVGKNWYAGVDGQGIENPFGRNPVNIIRANFDQFDTSTTGLGLGLGSDNSLESAGTYMDGEDIHTSKLRSQKSIAKLDEAISKVARFRADIGATQSRLNSTVSNLGTMTENYSSANSRIRDTDFAEETTKLTQSNILKQAGVAVLAQANQSPGAAVRLLG